MDTIVFTSNSGYTEKYAEILKNKLSLPVYSLEDAKEKLQKGTEIIYLGWLMAGQVKGLKKAQKLFKVKAVCGVGMGRTDSQLDDVKKANKLSSDMPVFTLQGGFNMNNVHGIYKFMMKTVSRVSLKGLESKENRTEEENEMLEMFKNGKDKVDEKNLDRFMKWYNNK